MSDLRYPLYFRDNAGQPWWNFGSMPREAAARGYAAGYMVYVSEHREPGLIGYTCIGSSAQAPQTLPVGCKAVRTMTLEEAYAIEQQEG